MIVEYYEVHLKFCPECGKELENNPISGERSCFLHGDFVLRSGNVVWKFTENLIKR
jgi:DNA-binding helix-hairpin-helix protein with protein kinase domain